MSEYSAQLQAALDGIEVEAKLQAQEEVEGNSEWADGFRARNGLIIQFGLENVALARLILDSALYQKAVAEGHAPTDGDIAVKRDLERKESESLPALLELKRLAEESDLAGFTELLERADLPDFEYLAGEDDLLALMESLAESDFSGFKEGVEQWNAYLETVGVERYWNEIYIAEARRSMAVGKLNSSVLDISADGPYEIAGIVWLDFQQEVLDGAGIKLTGAAPHSVSVESARAYLAASQGLERDALNEEYRRLAEQRRERQRKQRLTPAPTRLNPN